MFTLSSNQQLESTQPEEEEGKERRGKEKGKGRTRKNDKTVEKGHERDLGPRCVEWK